MDDKKQFYILTLNKIRFLIIILIIFFLLTSFFFLGLSIGAKTTSNSTSNKQKTVISELKYDNETKENTSGELKNYSKSIINNNEKNKSSYDLLIEDNGKEILTPLEKSKSIVKSINPKHKAIIINKAKNTHKKIFIKKNSIRKNIEKSYANKNKLNIKKAYKYAIQIFATTNLKIATNIKKDLIKRGFTTYIIKTKINNKKNVYKIKIGPYTNKKRTLAILKNIKIKSPFKDAFVTPLNKSFS